MRSLAIIMAALTWFMVNVASGGWCTMDETNPSTGYGTSSGAIGWIVSTGSTLRSKFAQGAERAAATFDATTYPNGTLDTSIFDALRSTNAYTGNFAAGNWTMHGVVRAQTAGSTQDGVMHFRVFKADANGSNAVELTSGDNAGATVTNLLTSVDQDSSATISLSAFSIVNQYIFVQIAWERTGAGAGSTADVNFRIGSAGTRLISTSFTFAVDDTDHVAGSLAQRRQVLATPVVEPFRGRFVGFDHQFPPLYTVTKTPKPDGYGLGRVRSPVGFGSLKERKGYPRVGPPLADFEIHGIRRTRPPEHIINRKPNPFDYAQNDLAQPPSFNIFFSGISGPPSAGSAFHAYTSLNTQSSPGGQQAHATVTLQVVFPNNDWFPANASDGGSSDFSTSGWSLVEDDASARIYQATYTFNPMLDSHGNYQIDTLIDLTGITVTGSLSLNFGFTSNPQTDVCTSTPLSNSESWSV